MRKLKSKMISLLTSTVLLSTVLAGCGSSSNQTSTENTGTNQATEATKNEPVTLTMLVSETIGTKEGFKAVVSEIEKKLNIKTEIEIRPGGPEGENIVKTRLATGDMADLVVYNSGSLFKALNPEQHFVDLTSEPFMANVLDTFKGTVTDNGKVFGIPAESSNVGAWLYNKKVYQELGLKVPKTWDELMANNEKIKAAGKTAVIGSYKTSWTSQLVVLADYYNVQAQDPNFAADFTANKTKFSTNPAALRGFEKLQEISEKGYMNADFNSTTFDQGQKMLVDGTGVHYPILSHALSAIYDKYPDKINDIGIFPQPGDSADKDGLTVWMPNTIMINKESENIDAAKKWLEYFISPEALNVYVTKSKGNGPFVIKGAELPEDSYQAVKEMLPYFESGNVAPALEFHSPVKGPNLPQITSEVGGGIRKAKEAAEMYDKDVEKQAKQLGLPGW